MPRGTGVGELARLGLAPGVMSAGLGSVPAEQTYLDMTQGNRVFDSLYDSKLPRFPRDGDCAAWRRAAEARAASAPADIVPGLLTERLRAAGIDVRAGAGEACAFSPSADVSPTESGGMPNRRPAPAFAVRSASLRRLGELVPRLRGEDLLIAVERPPPAADRALAIGIAGRGFDGNLTSPSTRLDGYVLSTDLAPTVLRRFGLRVPSEMSGEPIHSAAGGPDAAAVESLAERLAIVGARRGPVVGVSLLVWLLGLAAAFALARAGAARAGTRLLALSVVYLPLVLLLAAALEPSQGVEQGLTMFGAPLLGLLTLASLRDYRALALASALTVVAYAVDVIAGSPLTSLSLLGPNPGLGVRFYGIGNELEALLAVLVLAGTGAALTGFAPRAPASRCAAAFLAVGLLSAAVFAAGRFGADVGAAIVLPLGAAVAAALVAARRRRVALLALVAPLVTVALLALVDLVSGADAHLTRSVLDAGGLGDLADVAQRRLQLSSHSFTRPVVLVFLPLTALAAALAVIGRRRLAGWMRGRRAIRAGLTGALAATLVGALANDSGALILEIGAAYLLVFTGFAWAESRRSDATRPIN